jgi:rubrerythrin
MAMSEIHTASATISFARKLEEDSSQFYSMIAQRYPQGKDIFLSLAKENGKFITQFERAYYSVISDAIEGCFAFNINPDNHMITVEPPRDANYVAVLTQAIELESRMIEFYSEAAEQSKSLLADVPRAFSLIANKRESRRSELKSLLSKAKG